MSRFNAAAQRGIAALSIATAIIAGAPLPQASAAELPVARLDTVFPPGGKAGSEVDVAVTGADLDEAKALLFSNPGITTTPKDKGFTVKIAPEVPPGIYDVRVSGLLGLSNPRGFVVGDLPQTVKAGANATIQTAVELPIDSSVTGTTTAAVADHYKFTAKKGQRMFVTCDAADIDSQMVPVLTLLDANGQELKESRRSGFLDFTAPADGSYIVQLHDQTFSGGPEFFYRLALTTASHLDFVFPPCGQAGRKSHFTLYGRNLPGSKPANLKGEDGEPLEKLDTEIELPATAGAQSDGLVNPAGATVPGFSYRLPGTHVSNPVFIGFASLPVVTEQEPNNDAGHAQKITPPCEIAGQFFPAGDTDVYTFDAKKGEVWCLDIISQRLDRPTSPFLVIQRDTTDVQEVYAADTNLGGVRFRTTSNDPSYRFEVKEDGMYRLVLRDLFGTSRHDPRNVYRLVVRKESPDFQLLAVAEPPPEKKDDRKAVPFATLLRANGTTAIKVVAFRADGFAGDIELHAEDLPPGVTCAPTIIPGGMNEGLVLLNSCEKPEAWAGYIKILGKAKIGGTDVVQEARGGAVSWTVADANNDSVRPRLTRGIALAVSAKDTAPMSLTPTEDKRWEIPANGKAEIPLKIARSGEFKEALKLKPVGAPGLETAKEIDVAADAANATATIDLAAAKMPAGEYTIHFEALTKGKFRGKDVTTTIFSTPIRIAVQAAPAK